VGFSYLTLWGGSWSRLFGCLGELRVVRGRQISPGARKAVGRRGEGFMGNKGEGVNKGVTDDGMLTQDKPERHKKGTSVDHIT